MSQQFNENVGLLMSMGFSQIQANQALLRCNNNIEMAANMLMSGTGGSSGSVPSGNHGGQQHGG